MTLDIASVVEGHGEVAALPILLRRILMGGAQWPEVRKPSRLPRSRFSTSHLENAVRVQSAAVRDRGGVLVLVDADDDVPADLIEELSSRVRGLGVSVQVAVAVREYEAWFLAGIDSLRAHPAILDEADFPQDPETPRDAKGRLERLMTESYSETLHQPAFSTLLDLEKAKARSASFRHFCASVEALATS